MLVEENVIAMIEGNHINTSDACALSAVTGIPVISLRGDTRPTDECVKTVQIQAGYRTYAHATLDILNTFQWKNIALLYEGKPILPISVYNNCTPKPTICFSNQISFSLHCISILSIDWNIYKSLQENFSVIIQNSSSMPIILFIVTTVYLPLAFKQLLTR